LKISKIALVCILALGLGAPIANRVAATTTPTKVAGKFVVDFTITIASAIPLTDTIACSVTATVEGIDETATVAAVRKGGTATCAVTVPYSWSLLSAITDEVGLTYDHSNNLFTTLGVSAGLPLRTSHHPIALIKVPANDATTTETVIATF
jgi:hypothetical protein